MAKQKPTTKQSDLCWKMFLELRKETVEAQKIRAQVIGFKITFVSAAIGFIFANIKNEELTGELLCIPAFAAIFFDLLITSYSFSIKRSGFYVRNYLEPIIHEDFGFTDDFLLWEKFMVTKSTKQNLSFWGNLGITILTCIVAVVGTISFSKYQFGLIQVLLIISLALLFVYDVVSYGKPRKYFNK